MSSLLSRCYYSHVLLTNYAQVIKRLCSGSCFTNRAPLLKVERNQSLYSALLKHLSHWKCIGFDFCSSNFLIREVVISSVLDEDPSCVGVGGLCKIPPV